MKTIFSDDHIIISENQFAGNQLFMIISAQDEQSLMESIDGKENWIKSGCTLAFMGFNLLSLSVIPNLRLTNKGLVEVRKMKIIPLFE